MKVLTKLLKLILALNLILLGACSYTNSTDKDQTDRIKLALREVGHQILLSDQDSTTLVRPVIALEDNKYQLSFEKDIAIYPDSLVKQVKVSFAKANLSSHYLVEVLQCKDKEVAYSYEIMETVEKGIVPCGGRILKPKCYIITVRFKEVENVTSVSSIYYYLLGLGILTLLALLIIKPSFKKDANGKDGKFTSLGRFKFYPEQNKLVKQAIEINLSKKECEILSLFVDRPNQIIKRDELSKRVWEDQGVVVGRSLDTYISKLRKILKDDDSIKLTNIHGVGYKLEIKN